MCIRDSSIIASGQKATNLTFGKTHASMNTGAHPTTRALLALVLLAIAASTVHARLEVFASFEDQTEIAAIKTSPGVTIASSKRFAAWAENSLEVTIPACL